MLLVYCFEDGGCGLQLKFDDDALWTTLTSAIRGNVMLCGFAVSIHIVITLIEFQFSITVHTVVYEFLLEFTSRTAGLAACTRRLRCVNRIAISTEDAPIPGRSVEDRKRWRLGNGRNVLNATYNATCRKFEHDSSCCGAWT